MDPMSTERPWYVRVLQTIGVMLLGVGLLLAPWLLGTTPAWACWVTDGILIAGGGLILLSSRLDPENRFRGMLPHGRQWRWLAGLNLVVLVWFLIAAWNAQSVWDPQTQKLVHLRDPIRWLPSSHDASLSWLAFGNALALSFLFWGLTTLFRVPLFIRPQKPVSTEENPSSRSSRSSGRVYWILGPLAITGVLISVVGIIQRLQGTEKLLWLIDDGRGGASHFGPYPYRSNAAQLLNIIWPILFMVASRLLTLPSRRERRRGLIFAIAAAVILIGVAATASRGGALIAGFLFFGLVPLTLTLMWIRGHHRQATILTLTAVAAVLLSIPTARLLWQRLEELPTVVPSLMSADTRMFTAEAWTVTTTNRPFPLLRMYSIPTYPGYLYLDLRRDSTVVLTLRSKGTGMKTVRKLIGHAPPLTNGFRLHFVLTWGTNKVRVYINGRLCGESPIKDIVFNTNAPLPIQAIHINPAGRYLPKLGSCYLKVNLYEQPLAPEIASVLSDLSVAPVQDVPKPRLRLQLNNLVSPWSRLYVNLLGRMAIWRYTKDMLPAYPAWCGAGPNTFPHLYRVHAPFLHLVDPHVHQDILETRFNLGVVGTALILALLMLSIFSSPRGLFRDRATWGAYAAIVGCLIHGIADFPLHNQSVAAAFVTAIPLAHALGRLLPRGRKEHRRIKRRRHSRHLSSSTQTPMTTFSFES